jgi:putative endonuclease
MTNNLVDRIGQHKSGAIEGFTTKYKIDRLVYYETFKYVKNCNREKQIKAWTRAKRVALIEAANPTWEDLAADWFKEQKQIPRSARDDNSQGMVG